MKWNQLLSIFTLSHALFQIISAEKLKIVCYYFSEAYDRSGNGSYDISNIDPKLCTHLIYKYVDLTTLGEILLRDDRIDKFNMNYFNGLKVINPKLKTLVAIGGYNAGVTTFSIVAESKSIRAKFVQNALKFVQINNFDGIDFVWEYPTQRGGKPEDKKNFIELLKETKTVFATHGLLVSTVVSPLASVVEQAYNVPYLNKYVDFINVRTFDFHNYTEGVVDHHAPLYPRIDTSSRYESIQFCVEYAINNWISLGADKKKLILGIPFYGRGFTLKSIVDKSVGAASIGPSKSGPYTDDKGYLGYNEIMEMGYREAFWEYIWDDVQKVPHTNREDQWIGYDDERSVRIKTLFALENKLGGVMAWGIDTDDFRGSSGKINPLLNTIYDVMKTHI
ncbi:acidic mammalian chitinase-like [Diabrotica undecimpunctata]|uniref:acidic mammalian chitinase-like n=1 Tax=Diabrotica undecimpunctata TaxID=50387 RepID=UPI003B640A35